MDFTRLDNQFKEFLQDPTGATYSADLRKAALQAGVLAYSEYHPNVRRIGEAHLWEPVSATDEELFVIGGPFSVGDTVTIEDLFGDSEDVVVESVALTPESEDHIAPTMTLSLATPLQFAHDSGVIVRRSQEGMTLTTNRDIYPLPPDFVDVETESLDIALGRKIAIKRSGAYIDVSRYYSENRSQIGAGMGQNYGQWQGRMWESGFNPTNNKAQITFTVNRLLFRTGNKPSLRVIPTPTTEYTLQFEYLGLHAFSTLPEQAREAILLYADFKAKNGKAAEIIGSTAGGAKVKEGDMTQEDGSSSDSEFVGELRRAAIVSLDRFREIVSQPFGTTG